MSHHYASAAGINIPQSRVYEFGKFGRLFPALLPCLEDTDAERNKLRHLANEKMFAQKGSSNTPAGFTYLGQFIIHDLSFDPTSMKERESDVEQLWNFRTPALDLDSIYGGGPLVNPFLYDQRINYGKTHFLLQARTSKEGFTFFDVPRNQQGTGLIADARNDENLLISQLHVVFLLFHNKMVNLLAESNRDWSPERLFREAQRLVRWHYQFIILYDYLPRIISSDLLEKLKKRHRNRKFYTWRNAPFIPLEFSAAAFRFGHTQIRKSYELNKISGVVNLPIFDPIVVEASPEKVPFENYVDWHFFFWDGQGENHNLEIQPYLELSLKDLPAFAPGDENNLASINLLRGLLLKLPSGQAVAAEMGIEPILQIPALREYGLENNTPLWYYILHEASEKGAARKLGPVGERIVAEVIIGVIQGDKTSLLNHPDWKHWTSPLSGQHQFKMLDLLKFVGIAMHGQ